MSEKTEQHVTIQHLAEEFGVGKHTMDTWLRFNNFSGLAKKHREGTCLYSVFSLEDAAKIRARRKDMYAYNRIAVGDKFGRLAVASLPKRGRIFSCLCSCGNSCEVAFCDLAWNKVKSCGCLRQEGYALGLNSRITHGGARRKDNRLYHIWCNMKSRCADKRILAYENYGARGIFVCNEWLDFAEFRQWAAVSGYQLHLTIDRVDVDGPYHPDNCRWATMQEQQNNCRSNVFIEAWGEEKTMKEWSRDIRCSVCYATLKNRLQRFFWEPERAISEQAREKRWS